MSKLFRILGGKPLKRKFEENPEEVLKCLFISRLDRKRAFLKLLKHSKN